MLLNCGVGEDSWESLGLQGDQTILKEISPEYSLEGLMLKLKLNTWPPDAKNQLVGKEPDAGKDWRQEEKGTTEDKMVGCPHWLDGHEFEQAPGVGDEQGSLACCNPRGHKELDMTEGLIKLKHTEKLLLLHIILVLWTYTNQEVDLISVNVRQLIHTHSDQCLPNYLPGCTTWKNLHLVQPTGAMDAKRE